MLAALLKRLFGLKATQNERPHGEEVAIVADSGMANVEYDDSDSYFRTMSQMRDTISRHEYDRAARLVRENLGQVPGFLQKLRQDSGSSETPLIPALKQGGTILALMGDDSGLAEMERMVASLPELQPWVSVVEGHLQDLKLFKSIVQAVAANPDGCLQTEVKQFVAAVNGRHLAKLIAYLEKAGIVSRIREGRTHRLMLTASRDAAVATKRRIISHRKDKKPPRLREIDTSSLRYIPLPRAPIRWEDAAAIRERGTGPDPEDLFEIRDADWSFASIEKMSTADRPDTAFRRMYSVDSGLLMIDDLGKAEGFGSIAASAIRYDRSGRLVARAGFENGVCHLGVHPLGRGLIAMSAEGVVHAYDDGLRPLFQTTLTDAPEILALRRRFDLPEDQIRSHVRSVALSRDNDRYLFTAIDEAWCIDTSGFGLWGVKLPMREGWKRIPNSSGRFGSSMEIEQALKLMNLSLPFRPEEIKARYRELAMIWHPDHNPGDPAAEERMRSLNGAAEVLTGVNESELPHYSGATFVREFDREEFVAAGLKFSVSMVIQGSELEAAERIYVSNFAARSDAVYLAGYAGRVVVIDGNGEGVCVYDVGSMPDRIMDTGEFLYILTGTRLYVLRDDSLHALIDTFESRNLIIAQSGFGLLENKRFRWFSKGGSFLGSVVSKDPIRRVYWSSGKMMVETRQRRASVCGVPAWWG